MWKDAAGEIVYVGKAANLRTRVPNYFAEEQGSVEREALREQIADLETIIVPNEAQALLLENTLIKEHQPKFNIRLRDDKSYPQIAVTLAEPFPRVLVVRRVTIPGARYFGPYTDVATLRQTLKIIRRIFTVRSCSWHLPEDAPDRPCLDFHIERCKAPCVGYQSAEDYRRMIDDVLLFLSGKTLEVRARLRERMHEASTAQDYERAAQLRDALKWLDQLEQPQTVEVVGGGDADAIGLARDGDDAAGVILRIREGRLIAREHRFLEHVEHAPEGAVLRTFIVGYYLPLEQRAQRVVLPFAPADFDALRELAPGVEFAVPQRGSAAKLVELADQNARHLLDSFKIESFEVIPQDYDRDRPEFFGLFEDNDPNKRLMMIVNYSTDVSNSARSEDTRSSTSASTVASRAVVGSSRISSSGLGASAIAIITRCCMPPGSWCGKRSMTRPGSEMRTFSSIPRARSFASEPWTPPTRKTSATCSPTRMDGFSAAPGF